MPFCLAPTLERGNEKTTAARAHDISVLIEREIARRLPMPAEITTHFEPPRGRDKAHSIQSLPD